MRGLVSVLGVLAASPELVLSASFTSIPESYPGLGDLGTRHCLPFSLGTLQPPDSESPGHFLGPHPPPPGSTGREGSQKQTVVWMCSKAARR